MRSDETVVISRANLTRLLTLLRDLTMDPRIPDEVIGDRIDEFEALAEEVSLEAEPAAPEPAPAAPAKRGPAIEFPADLASRLPN